MANSENSFADRLDRATALKEIITNLSPSFVPSNSEINAINFGSYLEVIALTNDDVSTAEAAHTDAIDLRRSQAEAIQAIALDVKNHVTSNRNWKKWHTPISRAADATRGYALPKKKTPPAGGTPPPRRPSGRLSQQGFADIGKLFGKLIESVKKITAYSSPPDSGLALADLITQRTNYTEQNDLCTTAESALETIVDTRFALYNDKETGLKAKMKAIKKAVRSQYKASSAAYASVKNIKL